MNKIKTIGLLGGTSWPSTIDYYRTLNELAYKKLGGFHSAKILLNSIDYHEIRSRYYDGRWNEVLSLLKEELELLASKKPDCIVICNNTLHKALDEIQSTLKIEIPIFHSVKLTGQYALEQKLPRILLLATKFTMDDGFYQKGLEKFGLQVVVPTPADRSDIQRVQSELAQGLLKDEHRKYFIELVEKYTGVDAIVLACTELPLAIEQRDFNIPVISPTHLQCIAAHNYVYAC